MPTYSSLPVFNATHTHTHTHTLSKHHQHEQFSHSLSPHLSSISLPLDLSPCLFPSLSSSPSLLISLSLSISPSPPPLFISLSLSLSGAFKPCDHLLGSWMIRLTVWFICVVALLFNALVVVVTFSRRGNASSSLSISTSTTTGTSSISAASASSSSILSLPARPLSSSRLLVGLLALANLLTGVYAAALVGTDAWAWGDFARVGVWWEGSAACAGLGALAVFSAEWAVLLLALAAVERSLAVRALLGKEAGIGGIGGGAGGIGHRGIRSNSEMRRRFGWAAGLLAVLAAGAGLLTLLPNGGDDGNAISPSSSSSSSSIMAASPLCLPFSGAADLSGGGGVGGGGGRWLGIAVALTLLNALAYLLTAGVYTRLYCGLGRAQLADPEQAAAVRHVAWLIFTNCLFFCPVAAFSFSPLLAAAGSAAGGGGGGGAIPTPDIAKSVLLIFFPLPACLNPVLYAFFSPAFRDDWLRLRGLRGRRHGNEASSSSVAGATAGGGCCGAGRGGAGGGGAKWVSKGTGGGVGGVGGGGGGLMAGVGCHQDRVAEDEEEEDEMMSQAGGGGGGGRGYGVVCGGYRQLGMALPAVPCQHCCQQVALLAARNSSSSSASPSSCSSSSSSSASGCRHLVKSHSCPALAPAGHASGNHGNHQHQHNHHHHHHNHHQHGGHDGRPLEALWDSGTPSSAAQSEYADEGDSLVSDSSEHVQACGRACFCHSRRGLPLVHYAYTQPRGGKD